MWEELTKIIMKHLTPYVGGQIIAGIAALIVTIVITWKIVKLVSSIVGFIDATSNMLQQHTDDLTHLRLRTEKVYGVMKVCPSVAFETERWLEDDSDKTTTPPKQSPCKKYKVDNHDSH